MALCGLALEGSNADLWTTLGVTARDHGVRQHALIQALHVNGDHALAWAELGQVTSSIPHCLFLINQCATDGSSLAKLYLKAGEHELAKEAFTRSRSVDPSLALTWAAMANMCDMSRQYVALCYYSSVKTNLCFSQSFLAINAEIKCKKLMQTSCMLLSCCQ